MRRRWWQPTVRWERQPRSDFYVGVAWGPQMARDTMGLGIGFGARSLVIEWTRFQLACAPWGWITRERRDYRLHDLAGHLVTPERFGR